MARKTVIFLIVLLGIVLLFCVNTMKTTVDEYSSPNGNFVVTASPDKSNLVLLKILNTKNDSVQTENTNASVFHKYRVFFLGDKHFVLSSSDVGDFLFSLSEEQENWHRSFVFIFPDRSKKNLVLLPHDDNNQEIMINGVYLRLDSPDFESKLNGTPGKDSAPYEYRLLLYNCNTRTLQAIEKIVPKIQNCFLNESVRWTGEKKFSFYDVNFIIDEKGIAHQEK